jgi:hypothetical protein
MKSISRSKPRKRQRGSKKDDDKNDRRDDKRPNEEDMTEEERDKDPHHTYKDSDRSICSIFGGKVALENEQQRKLTAQAIMAFNNFDEKRLPTPSIKTSCTSPLRSAELTSSNILERGHFPLVLDPVIRNVRFEKVLIDGGSALDILFGNALTKLDIKSKDLEPYDAPF